MLYKQTSEKTLNIIKQRLLEHKPSFLIPSSLITWEVAECGLLLNLLINQNCPDTKQRNYKSIFHSSGWESLCEAIRFSRQHLHQQDNTYSGECVIYNASNFTQSFINALPETNNNILFPKIRLTDNLANSFKETQQKSTLFILTVSQETDAGDLNNSYQQIRNSNPKHLVIIDLSQTKLEHIPNYLANITPDIVIVAENICQHEFPFAAFLIHDNIYKQTIKLENSLMFSSTYSGNGMSTNIASDYLKAFLFNDEASKKAYQSAKNKNVKTIYASYVNPVLASLLSIVGRDGSITESYQSTHVIGTDKYIDAVGCAGCNMRGHNPDDIISEVLDENDQAKDYWSKLCERLQQLLGLSHFLPAASGAVAVDMAVTMALLANKDKKTIITFRGNFAGKTLLSINMTTIELMQQFAEQPHYQHLVILDPFAADIVSQFEQIISSQPVALVWFELLRGQELSLLPEALVESIFKHREKFGYYIGSDQILTGCYRIGDFVYQDSPEHQPDVITLSKGLSDSCVPIAVAAVSEVICQRAQQHNRPFVNMLSTFMHNQLGSHIASHALEKAHTQEYQQHKTNLAAYLTTACNQLAQQSPLIDEFIAHGLLFRFTLKKLWWVKLLGPHISVFIVCHYVMRQGKVMLFYDRLFPAPTMTLGEAKEMIARLDKCLVKTNSNLLFIRGFAYVFSKLLRNML